MYDTCDFVETGGDASFERFGIRMSEVREMVEGGDDDLRSISSSWVTLMICRCRC